MNTQARTLRWCAACGEQLRDTIINVGDDLRERILGAAQGEARGEANIVRVQQLRCERHALGRRRPRGVDFLQRCQSRVESTSMQV